MRRDSDMRGSNEGNLDISAFPFYRVEKRQNGKRGWKPIPYSASGEKASAIRCLWKMAEYMLGRDGLEGEVDYSLSIAEYLPVVSVAKKRFVKIAYVVSRRHEITKGWSRSEIWGGWRQEGGKQC